MSAHDPDTPARLSAVQPFPLKDKATVTKIKDTTLSLKT